MNYLMIYHLAIDRKYELIMRIKQNIEIITVNFVILFTLLLTNSFGQSIPPKQNPPRLVNDFANILTLQERNSLEKKLVRFSDTTSNQITIVTVKSFNGYSPSMFAFEIGEKWQVGQKKFDNGIVIVVKPKLSATDKGRAFIAMGYGLEPAIPDAIASRIVNNEMIPYFRRDNYYQGLNNAISVLMDLAAGEISSDEYKKQTESSDIFSFLPFIILIIIIVIMRGSRSRSQGIGSRGSGSFWTALWLGSMLGSSGSQSGSWGNFSGGSSGFGGGGFGGFGGGSFGGGGAGGSW